MQLTLLKRNNLQIKTLPEKVSGKYTFINETNAIVLTIEPDSSRKNWKMKPSNGYRIMNNTGQSLEEVICKVGEVHKIKSDQMDSIGLLLIEAMDEGSRSYNRYDTSNMNRIRIGAEEDNDIIYSNPFISRKHAEIVVQNNYMSISDLESSNGTYLNNIRINKQELKLGDVVYILGLKVIMGDGFIALNNPANTVKVCNQLKEYHYPEKVMDTKKHIEAVDTFSRSPRFINKIKDKNIKIDAPPQIQNPPGVPLMFMLGPSMTMGMSSLLMAYFTLSNVLGQGQDISRALPTLSMSLCMMVGMVLWPILTKRFEKKRKDELEALRQEKYRKYLADILTDIKETTLEQKSKLLSINTDTNSYIESIEQLNEKLWNRQYQHGDFLNIRLGLGTIPLKVEFKYPEKKFTLDDDNLQSILFGLVDKPKIIEEVPMVFSLVKHYVTGIVGETRRTKEFVKSMLLQIVAMHSYDELKIIMICDEDEREPWEFVKWFPHTFTNDYGLRFFATNEEDVRAVSVYLDEILNGRKDLDDKNIKDIDDHFLIISTSNKLSYKSDVVKHILDRNKKDEIYVGYSIFFITEKSNDLPKECTSIIEVNDHEGSIYEHFNMSEDDIKTFVFDDVAPYDDIVLAKRLMNVKLDTYENSYKLPSAYTFMDMYKAGKVEHLNILERWRENNPVHSLKAPIGVDEFGDVFCLDLHEKHHGPHGLIAGMTGSGKSEFIITYILSVALNYNPDEVAFILIDFKGGGMADTFNNLPHVAGKITNLDDSLINRSLVSIESELKRRQRIFNKTSELLGISNIDIYKYQQLYRAGKVSEPVPHLIIISDEFAELKSQQPEFMDQLISTARIGRSLGVHLILATQKPSGVVNDQIWSNSKFRVCLKVQDKADSMEMLKRPEAASITQAGRYYVQVGYNELFEMGQSAWSGAMYSPSDNYEEDRDESAYVIDNIGRELMKAELPKRAISLGQQNKQVDTLTKYISEIASEENYKAKSLWLEPLGGIIKLEDLINKYGKQEQTDSQIAPIIGMLDDPENQSQRELILPISANGNVIIYGSNDAGKTTFLTTTIFSIITTMTASDVNIYILDFGNQTLKAFSEAPHIGDVVLGDEQEKIESLFKLVDKEISKRRVLFANYGGDISQYKRITKKKIESIIIAINDYGRFKEAYEACNEKLIDLSATGSSYGIYFILTTNATSTIRFKLMQNFNQLFALQFNDDTEYTSIVGHTSGLLPAKHKGRGLVKLDKVYEYQIARVTDDIENTYEFIQKTCMSIKDTHRAKSIPTMPEILNSDYFMDELTNLSPLVFPIGLDKSSYESVYIDMNKSCVYMVSSLEEFTNNFVQSIDTILHKKNDTEIVLWDASKTLKNNELIQKGLEASITETFFEMVKRNNAYKDALTANEQVPVFKETTFIINGFYQLVTDLSDDIANKKIAFDTLEKLEILLEKNELAYGMKFIIIMSASNIKYVNKKTWFVKHCKQTVNLWIGDGISSYTQYIKMSKFPYYLQEDIGSNYGYVIDQNKAKLLKLMER